MMDRLGLQDTFKGGCMLDVQISQQPSVIETTGIKPTIWLTDPDTGYRLIV